ncbi:hypothetical protein Nepgr_011545 [Nepenthes gracilis]|uniref:SHSP domain-containing protein n=1 Tax=Nepenthes gracilis TaxID=150966 RepID=A0AAD3XME7_NEPGR|nr:hypothetical protein Nepgr_011545 [Nepenthes gracilis]
METKLGNGIETVRRAAPASGGCNIEGHLCDKQESEHEELQQEHVLLLEESGLRIQTRALTGSGRHENNDGMKSSSRRGWVSGQAGFKKDQLRVQVSTNGVLKISGERPVKEDGSEKKRFFKETSVPTGCDISEIKAQLISGRLHIVMPKKTTPLQPPELVEIILPEKPAAGEACTVQEKMAPIDPDNRKFGLGMSSSSIDTARLRVGNKMAVGLAVLAVAALVGAYAAYKYRSSSHGTIEDTFKYPA